ncbi:hypothetical protein ARMSODRAFT_346242 [Armillaria solidipes]|uniref:Uncharacterized protein n=1 Tax=Armillaria solidipes TaxID=1076256 RepID=A0A2H3BIG3_9AGAR|nr:hypothetical protein ARMSODRAFT_346242 [Armillaria solidipes]
MRVLSLASDAGTRDCYPFGLLVSWRALMCVLSLASDAGTGDCYPFGLLVSSGGPSRFFLTFVLLLRVIVVSRFLCFVCSILLP